MLYVWHAYILVPLLRPHVRHVCVLMPFIMPHVRYAHLGLYIGVILKVRATRIWSFGCGFTCATTIGCAGFKLSFGIKRVL